MSFLGTLFKGVVGFATGGPLGAIAGIASGLGGRGGGGGMMMLMPPTEPPGGFDNLPMGMPMPMGQPCPPGTSCRGMMSTGGLCLGSCAPIPGMAGMVSGMVGLSGRCPLPAPRGFHWNQKTYCTVRSGIIPKCTRVIKNRHLNPANGRAARRAVRRIAATHKLLKRIEKSIRRIKGVRGAKLTRQPRAIARGAGERVVAVG